MCQAAYSSFRAVSSDFFEFSSPAEAQTAHDALTKELKNVTAEWCGMAATLAQLQGEREQARGLLAQLAAGLASAAGEAGAVGEELHMVEQAVSAGWERLRNQVAGREQQVVSQAARILALETEKREMAGQLAARRSILRRSLQQERKAQEQRDEGEWFVAIPAPESGGDRSVGRAPVDPGGRVERGGREESEGWEGGEELRGPRGGAIEISTANRAISGGAGAVRARALHEEVVADVVADAHEVRCS